MLRTLVKDRATNGWRKGPRLGGTNMGAVGACGGLFGPHRTTETGNPTLEPHLYPGAHPDCLTGLSSLGLKFESGVSGGCTGCAGWTSRRFGGPGGVRQSCRTESTRQSEVWGSRLSCSESRTSAHLPGAGGAPPSILGPQGGGGPEPPSFPVRSAGA